jgi:2-polyprenyl-6-methoxyphenol hydroxylase-like FAD-dependent oxidoreductase
MGFMQNKSVLISGIGIAGPTLAYWLSRYGFSPTLIEVAPAPRKGGYVIDFWGDGYEIAARMGLEEAISCEGYHVQELRLVNDAGERVASFGTSVFSELTGGRYVSIERSALARLIYNNIDCEVVFGDSIGAIQEEEREVRVRFQSGTVRHFDLVIGAGGLHSQVRKLCFGPQELYERHLGYVVAAFEAEGYPPRDENVYMAHSVPGRQIARFSMRNDRTLFLFVIASDLDAVRYPRTIVGQKAFLRRLCQNDGWEVPRILGLLDNAKELYFDRVSQIHMGTWTQGRIALVGDAAFCVSLLAGQGAALAMIAAFVLAGELAKADGNYKDAFHAYETMLRPFIERKQRAAQRFGGALAPKTEFGITLRNLVMHATHIPGVAKLAMGRDLIDNLQLPTY